MLLYLTLIFIPLSFAIGDTSLTIVHPRNPSHQKDSYTVSCKKNCDLKVTTASKRQGTSPLITFETKINELIAIAVADFPNDKKIKAHQVLYFIKASDGVKNIELILGYPKSYLGEDYKKYSDLIVKLEELKSAIIQNTTEEK